jgi:peroxiredoxin
MRARGARRPRWRWAALVVAVVGAFAVGVATQSGGSGSGSPVGPDTVAPPWSGRALDGASLSSHEERGRWVILNFFATWCGPCLAETPQLVRFSATNRASTAQVVGIIFSDSPSAVRSFAGSHHVTWPLLTDAGNKISSAYRVVLLPQSFVITPNGKIAAHLYGGVTAAGLDKLITKSDPG